MASFSVGDTVRLKSGGLLMTVVDLSNYGPLGPEDGVKCMWNDENDRQEHVFNSAVLKKSDNTVRFRRIGFC